MVVDPETEGQLEFSPYHYSFDNPIRYSDPDGRFPDCCKGLGDFMTGVGNALSEDLVGGSPIQTNPGYVDSYNNGRTVGHYAAMVVGATEIAGGLIGDGAAITGEFLTVGIATPVAVPLAVISTAVFLHGSAAGSRAAENLRNDNGRVNAEGKTGSESNPSGTSRAARREAMREQGVPTSQPLIPDKKTKSSDKVFTTRNKSHTVQDAKNDVSHNGKPHWEVGPTKKDPSKPDGLNRSGSNNKPQMGKPKSKAYYNE